MLTSLTTFCELSLEEQSTFRLIENQYIWEDFVHKLNNIIKHTFNCYEIIDDINILYREAQEIRSTNYEEIGYLPELAYIHVVIKTLPKQYVQPIKELIYDELWNFYAEDSYAIDYIISEYCNEHCLVLNYGDKGNSVFYEFEEIDDILIDIETISEKQLVHHKEAIKNGALFYKGHWFRTLHELNLYKCLKTKNFTIFPNHLIQVNKKEWYEIDFLILTKEGQGVIELNGNVHNGRSDYDHNRRRKIMDRLTLKCFEYYSNSNNPEFIVNDFLSRMNK